MTEVENRRKIPLQGRSRATVEIVLEAAAQLLESVGEAGFNTNAVAERAGVSIGTLYRYFPDKAAIMTALAEREMAAHRAAIVEIMAGQTAGLARDRAMVRAFIHAFADRTKARRVVMKALFARADAADLAASFPAAETAFVDAQGRPLSPVAGFVLTRAVQGAMRAAVMEGADFLLSQEFEDEVVKLGRAYLGFAPPAPATTCE